MHLSAALAAALLGGIATAGHHHPHKYHDHHHAPYSRRMLDSIKLRQQGVVSSGALTSTLESGVLAQSIEALLAQGGRASPRETRDSDKAFLAAVLDGVAGPFAHRAEYAATQPLDRFSVARAIEQAAAAGVAVSDRAHAAAAAIKASLGLQKRNPDGGLWYFVYPEWSYLDGMFSLLPFMAREERPEVKDMALQMELLQTHCRTNGSLLVHGYDWSRTAVWANPVTGGSPYVWGRSLGWFLAGIVETYDLLGCGHGKGPAELCGRIHDEANSISRSLVEYADGATGVWWQLTTLGSTKGNYLESSSTALFIFSMLKGRRIGLLKGAGPDYLRVALRAYDFSVANFVSELGGDKRTIGFKNTVAVNSLNSTASYEYYISQPITPNSLLGESAFILASLEVEALRESKFY